MKVDIYNTDKKYNIIYTDPPWAYNDKRAKDPAWGGITYNVLSIEEICNMGGGDKKNIFERLRAVFVGDDAHVARGIRCNPRLGIQI